MCALALSACVEDFEGWLPAVAAFAFFWKTLTMY
jgi:hypothetical protein